MYLQYYLLAYVAGAVVSYKFASRNFCWDLTVLALFAVIAVLLFLKKKKNSAQVLLAFCFCVGAYSIQKNTSLENPIAYQKGILSFTLVEKTNSPHVFVAQLNNSIFEKSHCILTDLSHDTIQNFKIGDKISAEGLIFPLDTRKNKMLYANKFVLKSLKSRTETKLEFQNLPNLTQDFLSSHLCLIEPDSSARSLIQAMIWGDTSELTSNMKSEFKASGTYHLLAISGMQVSLIISALTWFQGRFNNNSKKRKWISTIAIISIIFFFALVAGGSASVWRATIMGTIALISSMVQTQNSKIHTLTTAIFIALLFFPEFIFNLGFILSITAIIGIYFLHPTIKLFLKSKNFILDKILDLISITLSTQIALLPLIWFNFETFPLYFLFSNLILVPLCTLLIFTVIVGMLVFEIPYLNDLVLTLIHVLGQCIIQTNHFIAKLPMASINLPEISISQALVLAVIIALFFINIPKNTQHLIQLSICLILIYEQIQKPESQNKNSICFNSNFKNEKIVIQNRKSKTTLENTHFPNELHVNSQRIQFINLNNEIKENFNVYIFSKECAFRFLNKNELSRIRNSEIVFSKQVSKAKKAWIQSCLHKSNCEIFLNQSFNAYL